VAKTARITTIRSKELRIYDCHRIKVNILTFKHMNVRLVSAGAVWTVVCFAPRLVRRCAGPVA
jgi:hypothetical protein